MQSPSWSSSCCLKHKHRLYYSLCWKQRNKCQAVWHRRISSRLNFRHQGKGRWNKQKGNECCCWVWFVDSYTWSGPSQRPRGHPQTFAVVGSAVRSASRLHWGIHKGGWTPLETSETSWEHECPTQKQEYACVIKKKKNRQREYYDHMHKLKPSFGILNSHCSYFLWSTRGFHHTLYDNWWPGAWKSLNV